MPRATKRLRNYSNLLLNKIIPKPISQTYCKGFYPDPKLSQLELIFANQQFDVSNNCVIWSLRPLIFSISLSHNMEKSLNQLKNSNIYLNLRTYPNFGSRLFGQLELSVHEKVEIGDAIYLTATIKRVSDYTLPKHLDLVDNLLVLLRRKLNKKPFNFIMDDKDLRAFALFYSLPRPVVLVSVSNDGYDNLFPMDLIGSLKGEDNNEIYSLSLRQTSPSIELMLKSKQVAIAGVPIHQSELVYQLGEHHKKKSIDWSELSIQAIHSKEYELRVPEWSTQIEELLIKNSFELGSHRVFLCSTVSSVKRGRAELMHHVSGRFMKLIRKEK